MKRTLFSGIFLLNLVFLFGCVSQIGKDLKDVKAAENSFARDRKNVNTAASLDNAYRKFIMKYPGDTNLPRIYYEDAKLNDNPLNKTDEALNQFENVYAKNPQSRYAPEALIRAAFINETGTHNYDKAKRLYSLFLKSYPAHPLANDARISLENVGLTPEEQFKKIQAVQDSVKNQKKVEK